jgi:hypothetical protein
MAEAMDVGTIPSNHAVNLQRELDHLKGVYNDLRTDREALVSQINDLKSGRGEFCNIIAH